MIKRNQEVNKLIKCKLIYKKLLMMINNKKNINLIITQLIVKLLFKKLFLNMKWIIYTYMNKYLIKCLHKLIIYGEVKIKWVVLVLLMELILIIKGCLVLVQLV